MTSNSQLLSSRRLVADGGAVPSTEWIQYGPPDRGEVRLRTAWSLVSPGTELHYLDRAVRTGERFALGYCAAGTVESVGPGVQGFASGDRVIAMGWGEAVHGDVAVVPYRLCCQAPVGTPLRDAVVACLGSTAVHAVDRAELAPGDEVVVVGAGLVGQLVAQTAAARGCQVTLIDLRPERLRAAALLGLPVIARTGFPEQAASGSRCVFLCMTGDAEETLAAAARWAAAGPGRPRLVCVGRFNARISFSVELGNLDIRNAARCGAGYRDPAYARGLANVTAPTGEGTVQENLKRALDLIQAGAVVPAGMSLRVLPLEAAAEAYAQLRERPAHLAVLFDYGSGPDELAEQSVRAGVAG
jgi:threonine dehydrogenase-like Zn-dependent dehydrogenase